MTLDANQLFDLLEHALVEVKFTKQDGSERVMRCTLQPEFFSPDTKISAFPRGRGNCKFVVWEVDKRSWRSFNTNTIKYLRVGSLEFKPAKSMLSD